MARLRSSAPWLLVAVLLAPAGLGQDAAPAPRPSTTDRAVAALAADVEVERSLLATDLERYRELGRRRTMHQARLADLHQSLDAAVAAEEATSRERAETLLDQLEALEAERARMLVAERAVVERIVGRGRRIALLEQQMAQLAGQPETESGVLSGSWDIVLLPFEQRGTFRLHQSGTLIGGTYELDGGWTGSLQGTLVNRKVYLVRIDSRLGRSMELEGFLSSDGKAIRGNWLNYELAGSQGGSGQWSATRR